MLGDQPPHPGAIGEMPSDVRLRGLPADRGEGLGLRPPSQQGPEAVDELPVARRFPGLHHDAVEDPAGVTTGAEAGPHQQIGQGQGER